MLASQAPDRIPLAFATSGTKNSIPEQVADIGQPNDASYEAGFPPITMTPVASGGIPPNGADFNGVLFALSAIARWQSAGGQFQYNADFANDPNVGGYPKGAILESSDGKTLWLCLDDNNATDPDSGSSANWVSLAAYGVAVVSGLTNMNVTLTPAQSSKSIITLAGTLTGNVQVILPAHQRQWTIINNCTGAFSAMVKTASGTGVIVPGAGGIKQVYGDGANIVSATAEADEFVSGTRMLFQQSAAPVGWTKDVTQNDKALRIVSGNVVGGGTYVFSQVFTNRNLTVSVGNTSLSVAQMAYHPHIGGQGMAANGNGAYGKLQGPLADQFVANGQSATLTYTSSEGGGLPHSHSGVSNVDMSVLYVDAIIAQKD